MSDELISRQTAIEDIREYKAEPNHCCDESEIKGYNDGLDTAISALAALPSAQPEIIRCKDCKHWDGVDTCDVIDAPVWDNDFCSMAERRSDE